MPDDPYLIPKKLVDDPNRKALADPKVKSFLDKIGKSEGADYDTLVGGRKITDLSKHPNVVGLRTSAGPSTAFGKYQIVNKTDKSKLKKYADIDYSPENQDIRAVELLRRTGALDALNAGDESTAMKRAGSEWASIPGSTLPGRKNTAAWQQAQEDSYLVPKGETQTDDPYLVPKSEAKGLVRARAGVGAKQAPGAQDAVSQLMNATQQAKRIALRPRAPVGMGDVQQASRVTGRDSTVDQTEDELRVMKGEQPGDRQAYSRQQDAQTRLSRMQDESYREREAREAKDAQRQAQLQPEIERQTKLYRQDIQKAKARGGDANKWVAEFGSKAAGQLAEIAPGDTAKIHSEAALRAAEEEGADRTQLSKGIQNIGAGFIGSAPELGAMALGLPPVATFGIGSAIRSKSTDPLEVAKAAGHGAATGLAFEVPGVGQGITKAATKGLGVGATSAGIELAGGASPKEALISGATNALMAGVPEAIKLHPREDIHHSKLQPRDELGHFDGPPVKPTERAASAPPAEVEQSASQPAFKDEAPQITQRGDRYTVRIQTGGHARSYDAPTLSAAEHIAEKLAEPIRLRQSQGKEVVTSPTEGVASVGDITPSTKTVGPLPEFPTDVTSGDYYHGSTKGDIEFAAQSPKFNYFGREGIYLTRDPAHAEEYAGGRESEATPEAKVLSVNAQPKRVVDASVPLGEGGYKALRDAIEQEAKNANFSDLGTRTLLADLDQHGPTSSLERLASQGVSVGAFLPKALRRLGYDAIKQGQVLVALDPSIVRKTEAARTGTYKESSVEDKISSVSEPQSPSASVTPEAAPIKLNPRSFPKTVREAGYKAEDSTYEVLGNKETVAKANQTIKDKGIDLAVAELGSRKEFSPEDVAVGSRAIQEYEKSGQMDKAIDTVEKLAENLTKAGQTVQAASIIARLSPEGTLLYAQRKLPKGVKLKPEQGEKLVAQAAKVRQADLKIGTLNERIEQMQKESAKLPKTKIGTLEDRLIKMEADVKARLAARVEAGGVKGPQAGASTIPLDIADYAILGAVKLARKGVTLAKWSDAMIKEFGEEIRPQLKSIYKESYKVYDDQRKQFAQEAAERSARKAEPNAKDIQAVINQRALARKDARTHKAELSRLFKDLSLTKFGKVKATAVDVISIPRSLKSSVDLSAPRQGAMWMINHPVQGAKLFFGKQLKAMREVNYDRYVDQLESDPDYPLMTRSELALPIADQRPNSLSGREEAFMSRIAGKIPGVSHSERAYSTFITTARVSWFKQLKAQAELKAKAEGKEITPEQYKAIANFVNIGTGRGNLGKGTLNKMSPFLNAVFFAPKFAASKVQIFDPRVYARLPKGARTTAMREAATYFGAMSTAALLLKYGMGAQVGLDPEESEFMKARVGNTRYDLSNGTGQYVRLAASLLKNAENKATGKKDPFGKGLSDNVDRFLRYKLSPPAAFGRNVWEGKNAIGEKTSAGRESLELITPLFLKDLYDAYKEEGLTGVAKTAPGFVGVGVNTYGDRAKPPVKLNPRQGSAFKF